MIQFKYDNINTEKLILEFKCKECHSLAKTKLLSVPQLDFDTFKDINVFYKHKCQCGACYTIEIINSLYDGYGIIHGIDGEEKYILVHEYPDIPYDKSTILVDTIKSYSRIESIVSEIEGMSQHDKSYIYCLLFTNLITILDSFIKIYTEPIILCNDDLIEKFSIVFEMSKGGKEEKIKKINNFYRKKSFQSISNQKKLFNNVFNVDIEIDDRVEEYVELRDVIIHRNSIDPEGYIHKISKSQLLQALDVVKMYIHHIYTALLDYEIEKIVNNLINK